MKNNMAKKKLYVVHVLRDSGSPVYDIPVYCLAVSPSHAKTLALRFCIDEFYYELDSFTVCDPILLTYFVS